jgi:preprotein translocase subunit SecF
MREWFRSLVTLATRWPRACLTGIALLVVAGALAVVLGPLDVSTSRQTLVSEKVPHQARLREFHRRFGLPDSPVLVISGGSPGQRRLVVDHLLPRLEEIPELTSRVLGRLGPEQLAEVIFFHAPELLDKLGRAVEEQGPAALEGSLAACALYFERRIQEGLDGEAADPFSAPGADGDGKAKPERALQMVAGVLTALSGELEGGGPRLRLGSLLDGGQGAGQRLDEYGYLVSEDGELHFVVMFPELQSDEGTVLAPLVNRIREAVRQALRRAQAGPVTANLTGVPALAVDELEILRKGSRNTSVLSAVLILLVLYLAFRSPRPTLLALTPLAAAIVVTLGAVELLYDDLNLVTSSFISVLLGLGIDFGVFLFQRYGEEQRSGKEPAEAMRSALLLAGPGVATEAVTTVLAFLTVATTDFTAFSELGVITVFGITTMAVFAFLLIPPLTRLGASRSTIPSPELPGVSRIMALVVRAPRLILVSAALITAGAVFSFLPRGPGYDGRFYDFLPEHTESYVALRRIEENGGMGTAFANFSAGSVEQARALAEKLRAAPEVSQVQTITDMLPPLSRERLAKIRGGLQRLDRALANGKQSGMPAGGAPGSLPSALDRLQDAFDEVAFALEQGGRDPAAALEVSRAVVKLKKTVSRLFAENEQGRVRELERRAGAVLSRGLRAAREAAKRSVYGAAQVPPLFRSRFLSRDGKLLALYAYPAGDIWQPEVAERFEREMLAIDPGVSGLAVNIRPNERLIIGGFQRAALLSALLIALTLLVLFRNARHAALALLPVALGWIWMLGAMKPLGLVFNAANMVALPLLMGIGVNTGSQIMYRYRQSRARGEKTARLGDLVRGTGAAVIVASLTTMAGFGALMTADYRAMQSMGMLLTVGIGLCLLASVLVLPALLVVLGRAR